MLDGENVDQFFYNNTKVVENSLHAGMEMNSNSEEFVSIFKISFQISFLGGNFIICFISGENCV